MFPAHAGMDQVTGAGAALSRRVPRACGDGPNSMTGHIAAITCSPRMRGWTAIHTHGSSSAAVFPAHAGMDRLRGRLRPAARRVPRACGDGPDMQAALGISLACSPRMRGWTDRQQRRLRPDRVFPAHAGMDRKRLRCPVRRLSVPRACGDGPPSVCTSARQQSCSPRMRGWTGSTGGLRGPRAVFPAHAGMDRPPRWPASERRSVPRACGDGPVAHLDQTNESECSPRMRGWTVLGCGLHLANWVFPAHAGMDRPRLGGRWRGARVPRACGDGPGAYRKPSGQVRCSPRMRGWTVLNPLDDPLLGVFPAHAGMDRVRTVGS